MDEKEVTLDADENKSVSTVAKSSAHTARRRKARLARKLASHDSRSGQTPISSGACVSSSVQLETLPADICRDMYVNMETSLPVTQPVVSPRDASHSAQIKELSAQVQSLTQTVVNLTHTVATLTRQVKLQEVGFVGLHRQVQHLDDIIGASSSDSDGRRIREFQGWSDDDHDDLANTISLERQQKSKGKGKGKKKHKGKSQFRCNGSI